MNEAKALMIEAGKAYKIAAGLRVMCVGRSHAGPDDVVMQFPASGPHGGCLFKVEHQNCFWKSNIIPLSEAELRIVGEWSEPKRIKGYVNLYAKHNPKLNVYPASMCNGYPGSIIYKTRKEADALYERNGLRTQGPRIACIEIDVLEGHGLQGEAV